MCHIILRCRTQRLTVLYSFLKLSESITCRMKLSGEVLYLGW